ncbi:XRE family transcriptional regulator [Brevundimonas sp.]|uniref:XRE family transcriptional regulator n=1 Tax=Brevundimonas sp. TaxID=1871086 RepID=UPI001212CBAB|nr:XRE family transcriptional regulator [Brevundimonas sp.]TAJ63198.1 MAG: helix-turn-helix domain-containing protein [Brevundimonas sp.]
MAILNHRDYRLSKARLEQLRRVTGAGGVVAALAEQLPANAEQARRTTLEMELGRLTREIAAYEELRAGDVRPTGNDGTSDLGLLPILARISRQLSQRELAERLGMREQQIQRYEKDRYSSISLERYQTILRALDVDLQPRLTERPNATVVEGNDFEIELSPDLLRELRKRNWVDLPRGAAPSAMKRTLAAYVAKNSSLARGAPLNRRTRSSTAGTAVQQIWTARVLESASSATGRMKGKFNIADSAWLAQLVALSVFPDGPVRAMQMLRDHGIIPVIEPHLPRTLLDGAALMHADGIPVVALTLRHDRLDNFWFTLLHELAHVFLHFSSGLADGFIDDDLGNQLISDVEREADDFARNRLIPDDLWKTSVVRFTTESESVVKFARRLNVHPAIVAGRIRNERDFSLFSELVGKGQLRKLFTNYST